MGSTHRAECCSSQLSVPPGGPSLFTWPRTSHGRPSLGHSALDLGPLKAGSEAMALAHGVFWGVDLMNN